MADGLSVHTSDVFALAQSIANQAEELRDELQQLEREWSNLSHGWQGVAATAYAPAWDEWHDGATKVVEVLAEESDQLARAAAAYDDTDSTTAQTLDPGELGL